MLISIPAVALIRLSRYHQRIVAQHLCSVYIVRYRSYAIQPKRIGFAPYRVADRIGIIHVLVPGNYIIFAKGLINAKPIDIVSGFRGKLRYIACLSVYVRTATQRIELQQCGVIMDSIAVIVRIFIACCANNYSTAGFAEVVNDTSTI